MSERKDAREKFEAAEVQVVRFEGRITTTTSGCCEGCNPPGYTEGPGHGG